MADTFKKTASPGIDPAASFNWKDVGVEKEHQPEKVKSHLTYRGLEQQMLGIEKGITDLTNQKTVLEAEMLQVKTTAEAE